MTSFRSLIMVMNALLIFFTLFHLLLPTFTVVRADGPSYVKKCEATKEPEICLRCLSFDPRSSEADLNGLVDIVFDCMNYHATAMQNQMWWLNLNSTSDAPTKQIYEDCIDWFLCAKSEVFAAKLGLQIGDTVTPPNSLSTALMFRNSCYAALSKVPHFKNGLPQNVKNELDGYTQLSQVASTMLENDYENTERITH